MAKETEMKHSLIAVIGMVALIIAVGIPAQAAVEFRFDPVDFFNYSAPTDGTRGLDGGMFRLHQTWGGTMYNSWDPNQNAVVDAFKSGLGDGEGIGCFNIWLADQANAPLWGETLISSGNVMPTGWAPDGWTAEVIGNPWPNGGDGWWLVQWYTSDPSKYIRPSNYVGEFGFTFQPTTAVTYGQNYTIWFGGANYGTGSSASDFQALYFDSFNGGFASQFVSGYGSGFEATLSLAAIPEPASILIWSLIAGGSLLGVLTIRRRGRQVGSA
jgi:hypothetical protein